MSSITDPDVHAFLSHGTRTGKLGWTARDGRPLVAPVWFVVSGDDVVFMTGATSAKGRSLVRDPRVVLVVDLEEPPYGFAQVQGEVTITRYEDDPDGMLALSTQIAARYMGQELADQFGRRNAVPGELLLRLRPTRVIASLDMTA